MSVSIFEFVFVFLRLSFGKLHTLLASVCSALSHKERLLAVDLAHPRIHMDFLVFVLVFFVFVSVFANSYSIGMDKRGLNGYIWMKFNFDL